MFEGKTNPSARHGCVLHAVELPSSEFRGHHTRFDDGGSPDGSLISRSPQPRGAQKEGRPDGRLAARVPLIGTDAAPSGRSVAGQVLLSSAESWLHVHLRCVVRGEGPRPCTKLAARARSSPRTHACIVGTRPRGAGRRPSSDSPPDCAVPAGLSPILGTAQQVGLGRLTLHGRQDMMRPWA